MEKVEKKKGSGIYIKDLSLKVLALIIAILVWLILSITEYPTINKTITNIPVSFSMDGTSAEEKGLQALGYKEISVDVEIKGMNYEIGSYSANDLTASVNVSNVTKEGTYSLDIDVRSTHSSDRVDVLSVTPSTVEVTFVHIDNSEFEVVPSAPNVKAEQGKTLKEMTVSPSVVNVQGSSAELRKISKVEARYTEDATLSEAATLSTDQIIFYDENNQELDSSKFKVLDAEKFDITFDVYKKKTVNFTVDFTDCPPGFDTASIPYKLSESQIGIITPNLEDVSVQTLSLGSISLKRIQDGEEFTFDVNGKIASGEVNQSGIDTVTVSFDFATNNYMSKNFIIPASSIKITNAPANTKVVIDTKQLPSVTMFGPESSISDLDLDSLTAVVDLSDIATTGSIAHSVTIYSNSYDDIWCIGDQVVQLEISEKTSDSSSNADSE